MLIALTEVDKVRNFHESNANLNVKSNKSSGNYQQIQNKNGAQQIFLSFIQPSPCGNKAVGIKH